MINNKLIDDEYYIVLHILNDMFDYAMKSVRISIEWSYMTVGSFPYLSFVGSPIVSQIFIFCMILKTFMHAITIFDHELIQCNFALQFYESLLE